MGYMKILIKDHKTWSVDEPAKSRPVMNGKVGMNCNMSEFLSPFLEPISNEDKNNMEVNATDGLICDIEEVNTKWATIREEDNNTNPTPQKVDSEITSHQEADPQVGETFQANWQ